MRSFAKWLGAGLGWAFGGPIGAILGYALGSLANGFTNTEINQYKRQASSGAGTQSGDFEISLLVLSAIVIKADGKIDQRELNFVRQGFVQMYGKERANNAFKLFKGIVANNKISTRDVCFQINRQMSHASRLQLLHFLFGIAKSDEIVSESEIKVLSQIATYLNINQYDFSSIKSMFYKEVKNAYRILGIDETATESEIKIAYRKLVKKYHPDKVQHLGPEHVKGAEEKFRQIQDAYDQIRKEKDFV